MTIEGKGGLPRPRGLFPSFMEGLKRLIQGNASSEVSPYVSYHSPEQKKVADLLARLPTSEPSISGNPNYVTDLNITLPQINKFVKDVVAGELWGIVEVFKRNPSGEGYTTRDEDIISYEINLADIDDVHRFRRDVICIREYLENNELKKACSYLDKMVLNRNAQNQLKK